MSTAEISWQDVTDRTDALSHALRIGGKRLPTADVARAHQVLRKVAARRKSGDRTVVVLAGATGSGKSSLFNALVAEPVSRIGARRPTTSVPTAAIWGDEPSDELLDWLDVSTRHRVPPSTRRAEALEGLVLLDLPDFDSRVAKHRAEADRMIELADVFVWVTDPQKYADAVLHDDYVRQLSGHDAVSLVVLNQIDRLAPGEVTECADDLGRLLAEDGLAEVPILRTSAVRGSGVDDLAGRIASVIQDKGAGQQRVLADVRSVATSLRKSVAARESTLSAQDDAELTEALCRAAGLPAVVDAVRRDYRTQAVRRGGWPFTRWAARLLPKDRHRISLDEADSMSRSGAKLALGRASLPPATPAARSAVDVATRKLGRSAAEGLPDVWADSVQDAATPGDERLHDALDDAVLSTDLHGKPPAWWSISAALQWLFAAAAVVGLVWLVVLAVLQLAQGHADWSKWAGLPIPLLLLVIGVVAGLLLALLSRWAAASGAERHAERVEARLRAVIAVVGVEQVINPIARELQAHRDTREALAAASR